MALAALLVGDGKNRHVTAESLHLASQEAGEAVSLATVYNTLRAFCEVGLVQEVTVDGSKSYFDTRTDDHPHFYWEDDGRLTDAPADDDVRAHLPGMQPGGEYEHRTEQLGDHDEFEADTLQQYERQPIGRLDPIPEHTDQEHPRQGQHEQRAQGQDCRAPEDGEVAARAHSVIPKTDQALTWEKLDGGVDY